MSLFIGVKPNVHLQPEQILGGDGKSSVPDSLAQYPPGGLAEALHCLSVFSEGGGWRFDKWLIMKTLVPKLKL